MSLPELPWFVWEEIIEYTVSQEKPEYCFLNKTWFKQTGGRFFTIEISKENPDRKYFNSLWCRNYVENVIFFSYNRVKWNTLYSLNIKKVEINFYTDYEDTFRTQFLNNVINLPSLRSLFIVFSYNHPDLNFLSCLKGRANKLLELNIQVYEFENQTYRQLMVILKSTKLRTISYESLADDFSFSKLSKNMPNLQHIKVVLKSSDVNRVLSYNTPMPRLTKLELIPYLYSDSYNVIKLDMNKIPNLKMIAVPGNVEFINIDKHTCKVDELKLFSPTISLSNQIYSSFDNLKHLSVSFKHLDHNRIDSVLRLCDRITSLFITEIYSDRLLTKIKLNKSNVTKIKMQGLGYLTNSLLSWLSTNFNLSHLAIEDTYTEEDIFYRDYQFDNLESVNIGYYVSVNICDLDQIFSLDRFSKLKDLKLTRY